MLAGFGVFEEVFDGVVEGLLGIGEEEGGAGRKQFSKFRSRLLIHL